MTSVETGFTGFIADPLFAAMANGECLWGDLLLDMECNGLLPMPSTPTEETIEETERSSEMPEDWDLEFPVLRLRKDIWENFPVVVEPLGSGLDGAERHVIKWHRKNFEDWRNACDNYEEASNYSDITEYRLLKCLHASKFWTVETSCSGSQLAIIRMNFVPRDETVSEEPSIIDDSDELWIPVVNKAPAPVRHAKPATPLFTRLNDIKMHFPVVWHKDETARTRTAVYVIEIFGKKIIEMSRIAGHDVRADVESHLMAALRTSPAWRVLPAVGREFCRLEME
jgi:hypothetical protein